MDLTDLVFCMRPLRRGLALLRVAPRFGLLLALAVAEPTVHPASKGPEIEEYRGMCDASAAVEVDEHHFLVASDEDSQLRLYRVHKPGLPTAVFDLTRFLQLDRKHPETDIEGAARVGDRAYWITSHGRNQQGKPRESRDRFFATTIKVVDGRVTVEPAGRPYKTLLDDLARDPRLIAYNLKKAAQKAPKSEGALNIEGLCATPGGRLLIGFRNPIPHGRALVVPLLNPDEMIAGRRARLGDPIELDLGGQGIRDLSYVDGRYMIVAGDFDSHGRGKLYWWDGPGSLPERIEHTHLRYLHPEAVVFYPGKGARKFQVISDDGTHEIGGCACKALKDPSQRRFRSIWISSREE